MSDSAWDFVPEGTPNFSWVLPGRLAASGQPARGQSTNAARCYAELARAGVRTVCSLLDTPPTALQLGLMEAVGLASLSFPIGDFGTPKDVNGFAAFVDLIHAEIGAGRPALVHCYAGIGRAGMCAAAYLARHGGFAPDEAVKEVRRLRPGSIETHGQIHVVRLVAAGAGA